jgi:hypothetical protein
MTRAAASLAALEISKRFSNAAFSTASCLLPPVSLFFVARARRNAFLCDRGADSALVTKGGEGGFNSLACSSFRSIGERPGRHGMDGACVTCSTPARFKLCGSPPALHIAPEKSGAGFGERHLLLRSAKPPSALP